MQGFDPVCWLVGHPLRVSLSVGVGHEPGTMLPSWVGGSRRLTSLCLRRDDRFAGTPAGAPKEVWEFHVGGYRVCEKWLRDRKGRTLTEEEIEWVASALARAEAEITLCHIGLDQRAEAEQRRRLRDDWDHFRVVPVDGSCLARASEIGWLQRVRTLDAAHLSAADRLPRPFVFVTFDQQQAAAARAMGLSVASDA